MTFRHFDKLSAPHFAHLYPILKRFLGVVFRSLSVVSERSRTIVEGMFFFLLIACVPVSDKVPQWDAQTQINAALDFKAKQCGSAVPQPPLYVLRDQFKRNVDLCSIAITRMDCPLDGYPIICMAIYLSKPYPEIKWYENFNELTKIRF